MDFQKYFPVWDKLTAAQQERLKNAVTPFSGKKGTVLHNGDIDCIGLLLIKSGELRVFVLSDEGREITLYRLFDMDICLFSASCVMPNIEFNIVVEAEKDTEMWIIPPCLYKELMQESAAVANYSNQ